ncbi:hypothetical protein ACJIZ3_019763 [Penstemon smallii]|uniref:Uncharacterized protein n=1 Tax=Penstemon smallii TaxID=265156 RepID=A0ABD3T213_9LAMI
MTSSTNDSQGKDSFNKMTEGLSKEMGELSTLYGVEACAIFFNDGEPKPEVWPSHETAHAMLERLQMLQKRDQLQKLANEEKILRDQLQNKKDELSRLRKENKKKELKVFMYKCMAGLASVSDFDFRDMDDMILIMNETQQELNARMNGGELHYVASSNEVVEGSGPPSSPMNSTDTTQSLD